MLQVIDPAVIGGWLAATLFVGIMAFLAFGHWLRRRTIAHDSAELLNVASLEAAVFGLLGLLIAFTFSGALTRFDQRRAQVVDEANAIGTAYLRVDLLPASAQPRMRESFRQYVDARLATYRKLPDLDAARGELERSQQLQTDIWAQAVAATRLPESRPGTDVLMMPALNQMFDLTTVRVVATQMHPPRIIYAMLFFLALASSLLAGYQWAGRSHYDWLHGVGFAAIVSFTVYVIIDIEYPRLGFVRIDAIDQVLVDVRAGMK
ncbi:MAG TPA: DUF4239 domain-containing protein [Burkholderiaceae bacterium]